MWSTCEKTIKTKKGINDIRGFIMPQKKGKYKNLKIMEVVLSSENEKVSFELRARAEIAFWIFFLKNEIKHTFFVCLSD